MDLILLDTVIAQLQSAYRMTVDQPDQTSDVVDLKGRIFQALEKAKLIHAINTPKQNPLPDNSNIPPKPSKR